jgi:choice-of-anchor B domain-containing protein
VVAALVLIVGGVIAVGAGAADPSSGAVSTDKPMIAWQGQHYDVGQTKLADACLAPDDSICDHFELTVDIDPSHWETAKGGVEVNIAWEDETDDFDLWVYDEEGALVGDSANAGTSSERVFIPEASGTYFVEVNPWDVTDSAYQGGAHVVDRAEVPTGGEVPTEPLIGQACTNGMAGPFPCDGIDLESFLPNDTIGGGNLNDIWGWTDPQTGREYAVVGRVNGTSFVDISKPRDPKYLGNLPSHQSAGGEPVETIFNSWRDVKVYKNHAFVVAEEPGHGMQVFDLTRLRGVEEEQQFTEDAYYSYTLDGPAAWLEGVNPDKLPPTADNAHNIAINEDSGFAYAIGTSTCAGGGPHMIDISEPKNPTYAGCVSEDSYTHDTQCVNYRESDPDPEFAGREICFNSNEDTLTVVDVTDKDNPEQLARVPYDGAQYTHQGWLTEDRRFFLLDDELDEQDAGGKTKTYIFNVEDLRNPVYKATHDGEAGSIDHNQYVLGERTYQANYRSGLRILDISGVDSGALEETGFFDIYPEDDEAEFNGAWSNYPYFRSGLVIVSGIEQGLFVLRPQASAAPAPEPGSDAAPLTARSKKPRVNRKIRVNKRSRGRVRVKCPPQVALGERTVVNEDARCTGKLVVKLRGKRVGRKRFSVAAGERRRYKVRIAKRASAANAGKRKRARVRIRGKRADGRKANRKQRVKLVFAG